MAGPYWTLRKAGRSVAEATADLEGRTVADKNELLFRSGIDFNDVPAWQKRGTALYWEGGPREGAGRKPIPGRRRPTPHRARPAHKAAHPAHVTLRARAGLPSLRAQRLFEAVSGAIARAHKPSFRVLHFSVQGDHVHLMVEAHDKEALSRGVRGLAIRIARAVNRALGRAGAVWGTGTTRATSRRHARCASGSSTCS